MVASVVATALGSSAIALDPLVGAATASASVAVSPRTAADRLDAARTARVAAEARLAEVQNELAALDARIDEEFAGAAELAADIEAARSQMRRSAINAYVNGGMDDHTIHLFSGDDLGVVSGRSTFAAGRTLDLADALAEFEALKEQNDPELVALVERREALNSRVVDALDAVFQSRANEADAERSAEQEAQQAAQAAQAEAAAAAARDRMAASSAGGQGAPAAATPSTGVPAPPGPGIATRTTPIAPPAAIVILTEPSAPLPDLPPGGPSPEAWAELRRCESGGNYRAVSRSGRYRGAYQFDQQTWEAMGGLGDPAGALPLEQDARARLLHVQRGARAWPSCGRALG